MTKIHKDIKNGTKFPNLRFAGFSELWQAKRLADICEINPKNENLPSSFIYIDLESVANGRLLKEDFISKDEAPSRAQRVLSKNDVLFQMVRPYQKNNLFFDKEGKYVASTGYAQIRTKQNSRFIFQYLHNQKFVDNVIERCTGTSYPAINSTDLGNIRIDYPSLEEQEKISSFLSLIDERIQTQNKIIEELKLLKNTLSKKIISGQLKFKDKNGNNFPEWVSKELAEVMSVPEKIKSKNIDKSRLLTVKLHLKGVSQNDNTNTLSLGATNYFIRKKGQFIYGKQNLFNGAFGIIPDEFDGFLSSGDVPALDIKHSKINTAYLIYFLGRVDFYKRLEDLAAGSGSKRIHETTLLGIKIDFPTIEEQHKIASFLLSIDGKIEIETNILQKLERQKTYFLANLFI